MQKEKISGIGMDLKVFINTLEYQVAVRFEYDDGNCEIWDVKSYAQSDLALMCLWLETIKSMATAFEVTVKQGFRFVPE